MQWSRKSNIFLERTLKASEKKWKYLSKSTTELYFIPVLHKMLLVTFHRRLTEMFKLSPLHTW